ncbi:FAD-dependent oxidoreductase [Niveispirillum sp.]|uniref:FAD-dependent oxidoreductase n=1 Tax=Niveispirillum sp. TaxID=1917217 RepID=UPI001B62B7F1|nr:FAD-dependent oxidoreductase [Niveispirillum sp.]MBP7339477.1 FAD-dependent oxidoreductase [Niveispirillum sp.]
MAAVSNILVIGGGIGGLTAATALRQQGITVDLIESKPDLGVYGVGIIQPNNTLRALDRISLARRCVELGAAYPGWRMHDVAGTFLFDAPATDAAAPGLPPINGITRPLLHKVLTDGARAAGATIRLGTRVETLDDRGDHVHVRFSDGREGEYDLVVGCDGVYSDTRHRLFGDHVRPRYTGQCVWRYNLPRPASVEWGELYFGPDSKVGLVPLSPDLMYMFVVTREPENCRYPTADLPGMMRDRLAAYGGRIAELAALITDPAAVVLRPLENLLLPAPWHKGRTLIIGDAAHATTPHLAQGAAMAIEDAVLLAELLGREAPVSALLDEFMARRFDRARFVVESSAQILAWEMEEWNGIHNPDAKPGQLLHEATLALMEPY